MRRDYRGNEHVGGGAHPRRIENLAGLSQPGRFATDAESVFYTLAAGEPAAPVLTTAYPHALIEGEPGVTGLRFQGITFELSARGPRPDSDWGHMETQTGYHSCPNTSTDAVNGLTLCPISAAVHFSAAKGVQFSDCEFRHMGGSGLWFDMGSQFCSANSSHFFDLSGAGVMIGGIGDPQEGDPASKFTSQAA